jgi:isoamyl acetate esterase
MPILTCLFLIAAVLSSLNSNHTNTMTTPTTATPPSPPGRPKILLLGDSLTQLASDGWGSTLAHVYQRRADVINRGMAGYNTVWYLQYAAKSDVWAQSNVKLVTIFFGANDASDAKLNPRHHVPVETFAQHLQTLIDLCAQHYPNAKVMMLAAPPVVHSQRLSYQSTRYGDKATGVLERTLEGAEPYAKAAQAVADANAIWCVPLWSLMQQSPHWDTYFYDGLHFTKEGNDFVAKAILDVIAKYYPSLAVTAGPITGQWGSSDSACPDMIQDGSYHDEIDHENCQLAFQKYEEMLAGVQPQE